MWSPLSFRAIMTAIGHSLDNGEWPSTNTTNLGFFLYAQASSALYCRCLAGPSMTGCCIRASYLSGLPMCINRCTQLDSKAYLEGREFTLGTCLRCWTSYIRGKCQVCRWGTVCPVDYMYLLSSPNLLLTVHYGLILDWLSCFMHEPKGMICHYQKNYQYQK